MQTPGDGAYGGYSSLTVSDGLLYIGTAVQTIQAWNASTGELVWIGNIKGAVYFSTIAVDNGVIYASTSWGGIAGTLQSPGVTALNAKSGAFLWNTSLGSIMYSSPAIANDIVVVGSDSTGHPPNQSLPDLANGQSIYALNAETGSIIWTYQHGWRGIFVSCGCVRHSLCGLKRWKSLRFRLTPRDFTRILANASCTRILRPRFCFSFCNSWSQHYCFCTFQAKEEINSMTGTKKCVLALGLIMLILALSVANIVHALEVTATIPVGNGPEGIAYDSGKGEIFVANAGSNSISVISDVNYSVIATIPLPSDSPSPSDLAYDSSNGEIFVAE